MNNVNMFGRIACDPEIRHTKDGKPVVRFSLAVPKKMKKDEANFFNIVCFNEKICGVIEKYVKKGNRLSITGTLDNQKYTDKKTKKPMVYTQIIINSLDLIDKNESNPDGNYNPGDAFVDVPGLDEELPFN